MRNPRKLIAALTFLAGLYFILDFVVPPTVPIATKTGVATATRLPSITVATQGGDTWTQVFDESTTLLLTTRDTKGDLKQVEAKLRELSPGRRLTVRSGTVQIAEVLPDGPGGRPSFRTADGRTVVLRPGEALYAVGENGAEVAPRAGTTANIEARDVQVSQVDRGSLTLLINGRSESVTPAKATVLLRITRDAPPAEVELRAVQTGDTLRVGPNTTFADNRDTAAQFNSVLETMALGMGLISLAMVNGGKLRRREGDWYTSAFFFLACAAGVVVGLFRYYDPGTAEKAFSDLVVMKILTAVGSAIFSLLAFYMASAAYRAFRIRTLEAGLMMGAALIVMLGQTPFGMYLTGWLGERLSALWLPNVAAWLLRVPNTALYRGLIFGIMLGAIATAIRYWLSLEKSAATGD